MLHVRLRDGIRKDGKISIVGVHGVTTRFVQNRTLNRKMGKVRELQNRISLPASASADEFREFLGCKPSSISQRRALPTSKLCWCTILDKPCGDPFGGERRNRRPQTAKRPGMTRPRCSPCARGQAPP